MIRETYLTRAGYERMKKELHHMKYVRRQEIAREIGVARAHGDISENAEYDAAKEAQAHLEKRIHEMENRLARVRVIEDENIPDDKIYIGAIVDLLDVEQNKEIRYILVSEEEADFAKGMISTTAPVGKALLGREEGDEVTIKVPAGVLRYEILKIDRLK